MSKNCGGSGPRRKGFDYERDLVSEAKDKGLEAKRAWGSNGSSLGLHEEVDLVIEGWTFQAKRKKSLAGYMVPNEEVDCVVTRGDRMKDSLVIVPYSRWLDVMQKLATLDADARRDE